MQFEVDRQKKLLAEGEKIIQETRHWDESKNITVSMRSKEEAHDYRYFPEPDLLPLRVSQEIIEEIRKNLPELPEARRKRFIKDYQKIHSLILPTEDLSTTLLGVLIIKSKSFRNTLF